MTTTEHELQAKTLRHHVETLATANGRVVGSAPHRKARSYLCEILAGNKLKPYNGDSFELPYGPPDRGFVNVIAVAPGTDPSADPVLIGAHYDTCGAMPGADDNAAAVAILLEMSAKLTKRPAKRDVVFAFFDAEEPPFFLQPQMGSIRFFEDQMVRKVSCALVLDLVGHDVPVPGMEDFVFVTGLESSSKVWSQLLSDSEPAAGIKWATILNRYVGSLSDHHIFEQNKYPYLFFSCGRWVHYHSPTDTPDRLNYKKMSMFQDALQLLVEKACEVDISKEDSSESLPHELHFLRKNMLPALKSMQIHAPLDDRKDIDRIVTTMLSRFSV